MKIYIDAQAARNQWRLRAVTNGKEIFLSYFNSKKEAERSRQFVRKVLFAISNNEGASNG